MKRRAVLVLATGLLLGGCYPQSIFVTPRLDVRVIDAANQQPITGALVTVWVAEHPDNRVSGKTDADGRLSLDALKERVWMSAVAPFDPAPPTRIRWEAAGYTPQEEEVGAMLTASTNGGQAGGPVLLPLSPAGTP